MSEELYLSLSESAAQHIVEKLRRALDIPVSYSDNTIQMANSVILKTRMAIADVLNELVGVWPRVNFGLPEDFMRGGEDIEGVLESL